MPALPECSGAICFMRDGPDVLIAGQGCAGEASYRHGPSMCTGREGCRIDAARDKQLSIASVVTV